MLSSPGNYRGMCSRWFHGKISRKDTEKMLSSPGNCHDMCCRWFHGKISRKDTEKMLSSPGNCRGMFLVRESESIAGNKSCMLLLCSVIF